MASTHIPEEDAECIHIHAVIILSCEEFWCHVYGCPNYAATHHGFRLTETQVCYLATIVFVKLKIHRNS